MGPERLPALFDPYAARGLTETYVFKVDEDVFTARIENGELHAQVGAAKDAAVTLEVDMPTFFALATGELEPRDAIKSGRARVEGDPEALDRCFRVLSLAPRVTAAA